MTNKNHKHFIQKACEQEILLVSACRPGIAGSIPARRRSRDTSYPNRPNPRKMVSAQTVAIRPAAAYSGFRFRRNGRTCNMATRSPQEMLNLLKQHFDLDLSTEQLGQLVGRTLTDRSKIS